MKLNRMFLICITLFILLIAISSVSASDLAEDTNQTISDDSIEVETSADSNDVDVVQESESSNNDLLSSNIEDSKLGETEEIIVNDWNELQYYCSLTDADYTLRLKENTNYYPDDVSDSSYQIIVNNNVKIIGNSGAYFGDTSPNAGNITYTAIKVDDKSGIGITVENVTFKWIGTRYQPDGVFLQMGGAVDYNSFTNCYFTNISTNLGHSSIVYIKEGKVTVTNCTFINCTTDFGCLSVYNPKDDPTGLCTSASMDVNDCYFEGNYARTEPGCINNCGILVVNNSTFYKNSAFWWAGAIHTHGGANTTIYDSDFIDNLAGWNGGALYTYSYLQIYNTRFIGNNCTTNNGGGAIGACKYLHAPYIHIEECLFENNENLCWGLDELSTSGTGRGGAISLMDEGGLEVYNSVFIKNSASIGTAICAINGGLTYGSPDVRIVGNSFINHTRIGDVLDVRVATGSVAEIRDNYYYNNSLVYEKLKLTADDPVNGYVTFHLDATLKNPTSFDADILDKSDYDVYMDGVYYTTVSNRTFTLFLGKGNSANVYVMPTISNSKSNEVYAGIAKTFIYVSPSGNDDNNGSTRTTPVKTLKRAIELANATENIVIMGGTFSDANLTINYNLTITGENGATITLTGQGFTITDGDVKFENLTFKNCKYGSSAKNRLISQTNSGFLILEGCVFESNDYKMHIEAAGILQGENLKFIKNKDGSVIKSNSISLKSSVFINNTATYSTAKGLVMYKTGTTKFEAENLTFIGNTVSSGCIDVKKNKATISDCTFIGNSITSGNKGSAILIEDSCSVLVESCKFINNTDIGDYSTVIYVSSGTLLIRDSILINNSYENSKGIVINGGETSLKKLVANNNWWGNTPDNLTKPALKVYGVSNQLPNGWDPAQYWLVLNATALSNEVELNERVLVQFVFTQIDNEGNVTPYDGRNLPSFDLILTAVNGTCSNQKITVTNGVGETYFTLTNRSSASLTGSFMGISTTINFTFKKSTPELSIEADNISVGQTQNVVVNVPSNANGTVILQIGNITKTENISNSKATFSIPGLAAGDYVVVANYTGNDYYESTVITSNFTVNKFESTTEISLGAVELGNDVSVTITVTSGATGTIDVYYNGNLQTIDVGETYTINAISRGDHVIRAIYSGDSIYASSEAECRFDVGKFIPTLTVDVPDITYGDDVVVTVTVDSGATGNVTVTIDGKSNTSSIVNNQAVVKLSGIDAGTNKYVDVFYSGCNDYKNASASKTFNIAKASLSFTISSNDIMLGRDAIVQIVLPARCGGSLRITGIGAAENKNVPASGVVTLTYEDLLVGTYTVRAQYEGNNYITTARSTTFEVLDWEQPQWANEGGDIERSGKSIYDTDVNGEIEWVVSVGEITGNLAIDSEGNIYVTTINGVSSFDNNGNLRWTYESTAAGDYFSGIAISRDIIIAPKVSDTLYFINQSTGERYGHANLYQGSSCFSPVVDSNGNIYIAGQGGDGQNPNLVVIPYKIWENGGNPTVIALGGNPVAAPTIVDDGLVVVPCDNGIKLVDVYSDELMFAIPGVISSGYAVVDEYGIIYSFLGDSIVARDNMGSLVWSQVVTGGVGKQLFLDSEIGIYSVNANGELYLYDILDGSESKFCDLNVTSGILIGSDSNLYFASNDYLYAFDVDGNVLWKARFDGNIVGTPIMDNNGIIYVNTLNKVFALMNADLKNVGLTVASENIDIGDDETINISLNENATGTVRIVVNGQTYTEDVINGSIVKSISNLPAGSYTARVTYYGDMRYSQVTQSSSFTVSKLNPKMNVTANNIIYGENAIFNVTLPSDATGTVSLTVGTKSGSASVSNGRAIISISGLAIGDYLYNVSYAGDNNYNPDSKTSTISVGKIPVTFTVAPIEDINVDDSAVFTISGLPSDANGYVTVVVGDESNSTQVNNGAASISIKMTAEGTYVAEISYSNDSNYMADSQNIQFNVNKIMPNMTVQVSNIKVGADAVFKVTGLPSDASGNVNVTVDGKSGSASVSNGKATVRISGLTSGSKTAIVSYGGNYKYQSVDVTKTFKVNKNNPTASVDYNHTFYVGDSAEFKFNLNSDAGGTVTVIVDGKTGSGEVVNGEATVIISSLTEGNKTPQISYSGDEKYNPATIEAQDISVIKRDAEITVNPIDDICVGENLTFDIILAPDMSGHINVVCGNDFNETYDARSRVSVTIPNLSYGTNDIDITYSGDSKYNPQTITVVANVIKNTAVLTAENLVMEYNDGSSWEVILTDNRGNAISNVGVNMGILGKFYTRYTDENGVAELLVSLKPGTYAVNATFEDEMYEASLIEATVTVNKVTTVLTADNLVMEYRDGSSWNVTLKDGAGNAISDAEVKFGVLGRTYIFTTDSSGVARLPIAFNPGTYALNASFVKARYESSFVNATVTVNKVTAVLTADNLVMEYRDGSSWNVTLKDGAGNAISDAEVKFGVLGRTYIFTTDSSGVARLPITLNPGTYSLNASFVKARYRSGFVNATLTVIKANPQLISDNLVMFCKDGSSYKVTLKDNNGNVMANTDIKFTILNRTYTLVTNAEGVASLSINLKEGVYDISARYGGSNKFNAAVVYNTITVKQSAASIVANDVNMVYKDGSGYNVQLVDSKGNAVAVSGETVKITIVNKTYNIKTNADGIAFLQINLKAGNYTVAAEYKNKTIYNTVTINRA